MFETTTYVYICVWWLHPGNFNLHWGNNNKHNMFMHVPLENYINFHEATELLGWWKWMDPSLPSGRDTESPNKAVLFRSASQVEAPRFTEFAENRPWGNRPCSRFVYMFSTRSTRLCCSTQKVITCNDSSCWLWLGKYHHHEQYKYAHLKPKGPLLRITGSAFSLLNLYYLRATLVTNSSNIRTPLVISYIHIQLSKIKHCF